MDFQQFLRACLRLPVTTLALVLSIAGYLFVWAGLDYSPFAYYPVEMVLRTGEGWRLISPVFLHFSLLHIVFNGLWIWELGRRIELYLGSGLYLIIFILLALAANQAQFYAIQGNNFGGLSGVVYGCLGFLLVARFTVRHPVLQIPDGLYVVMLIFMALGFMGVLDFLVGGAIGNAAHLGGFIMGVVLGLIYFGVASLRRS